MDTSPRTQSPEERSSFRFGLWALLLNLLCGCFPAAIVLGILSITKHNNAKQAAAAEPDRYAPPASTGMVLGVVGMCLTIFALMYIGIISAIAIPALLSQRGRARDKTAMANMVAGTADLVDQYDKLAETKTPPADIPGKLEGYLRSTHGTEHNPWNHAGPAFEYHIFLAPQPASRETVEETAKSSAAIPGLAFYMLELPAEGRTGCLVGAVRLSHPVGGESVMTKTVELD